MEQLNFTMLSTSTFSTELQTIPSWKPGGLIPVMVYTFCFLLGVPGNIAVILVKPNFQNLSSLSQSLVLNLAVSDLLCLLTFPIWIYSIFYGWIFPLVVCKLLKYLVNCGIYSSLLTVTALSVQRYMVVVRRQRCNHVQKRVLLVLLWVVAIILSFPILVVQQLKTYQQSTHCKPEFTSETQWVVLLLMENLLLFVSFSLMVFAYIRLYRKVNQAAFFNHPQTTRLMTSIIVSFFVLWIPFFTINMLGVAAICLKNIDLLNFCIDLWDFAISLTFVNSWLNPLMYAFAYHKMCTVCQQNVPNSGN
ncbi:C-C chemokine receptor type 4-like [Girardinichthys multiradiatus]|uniref:C-C chemokine receptor type 4-like n=1 Tax=Girardinichthys multiradiatus TaxID=208333 RepID=UPI001FAB3C46|nr:C-C chemokine receptor type 4-like [Girardinichthys multiradiatus]